MKVLVNLHTDDILNEAYAWSCKFIQMKMALRDTHSRAHQVDLDLSIGSKWGRDLYHWSVWFDSLMEYDKELFRSINFIGLGQEDDTYYLIGSVYNQTDLKNVMKQMFQGSMSTRIK